MCFQRMRTFTLFLLSRMCRRTTNRFTRHALKEHWILPEHDLNSERSRFFGHPVGNSPELMIMDCSLNKDVQDELRRHVIYTAHLPEDDCRKFSMSTPLRLAHAVKRIYKNSLSSKRIIQDTDKKQVSIQQIFEAKGIMLQNIGNRNGRRSEESRSENLNRRGGARVRMVDDINPHIWVHEDAVVPRQEMLARSERIFNSKDDDDVMADE